MAQATAGAPLDDRAVVRPSSLMERASRAIEEHPNALTKTALAAEVGGRNQSALKAIDRLVDLGHVETSPGARGNVYRCVKPFRQQKRDQFPGQFPSPVPGCGNLKDGTGEPVPSGNHWEPQGTDVPQQTASARPDKDHELPHRTGNGSEPTPVTEPRCRCCRRPDLRERINRMLANGFSLGANLGKPAGGQRRLVLCTEQTSRRRLAAWCAW